MKSYGDFGFVLTPINSKTVPWPFLSKFLDPTLNKFLGLVLAILTFKMDVVYECFLPHRVEFLIPERMRKLLSIEHAVTTPNKSRRSFHHGCLTRRR